MGVDESSCGDLQSCLKWATEESSWSPVVLKLAEGRFTLPNPFTFDALSKVSELTIVGDGADRTVLEMNTSDLMDQQSASMIDITIGAPPMHLENVSVRSAIRVTVPLPKASNPLPLRMPLAVE